MWKRKGGRGRWERTGKVIRTVGPIGLAAGNVELEREKTGETKTKVQREHG